MSAAVAVLLGLLGIPIGGFLNVVIDRVPDRVPLRGPRDGEAAAPMMWGPVPAQPWLLRTGVDRDGLPRRWLWVELATAVILAALGARFGDSLAVVPVAVLGAALVAVSVIDLQLLRIPDRVTFPALALALPLILLVSLRYDDGEAFVAGLVGAGTYFVALLVPHLVYPRGMGFGDVKLALLMGLYLGWLGWTPVHPVGEPIQQVLYGLMLGCILGVVFGLASQIITHRRGEFPFGPALALACLIVISL
ncbi:MAG TPA: A24 family peptidase [Acidimicrobiales bacterium]|nr:A24 family peptidase [Acidimicrobiales bacterium]